MDDLRAAAGRLRRYYAGDRGVYDEAGRFTGDVLALLAGHPADDAEPVTEDWLRAVGLPASPGYGVPLTPDVSLWTCQTGWGAYYHGGEGDGFRAATPGGADGPALLVRTPTRGHVRRLCAALGLPLKDAPRGS